LRTHNAAKCDCGRGPLAELAGFKGAALREGKEEKRKRGPGRQGKGREGMLTLMCSWNRAADWLRPALGV